MDPFTPEFDKVVEETLAKMRVPGVAFTVVHGDKSWTKGYGHAQLNPPKKVTESTLFYVASTTKAQLCAAWALYMASQDKNSHATANFTPIKWNTPLVDIIRDDFVLTDPVTTASITIEDAVSHRTGMSAHDGAYGREGFKTSKDLVRNMRWLPLHTPLRSQWEYCNMMYVAASHALETVEGRPLSQILRERLWDPLGMYDTYAGFGEAESAVREKGAVLAKGYTWSKLICDPDAGEGQYCENAYMDFPEVSGAGYVISTARDYAKWMRALLSASSPLTTEIVKELWRPRAILPPEEWEDEPQEDGVLCYALGWFRGSYRGYVLISHSGALLGAGSWIMLVPKLHWGVTFLANGNDVAFTIRSLAYWLLDEVLGTPQEERVYQKMQDMVMIDYKKIDSTRKSARKDLYPHAPASPVIPPTLALEEYAGTYFNRGYGNLKFTVEEDDRGRHLVSRSVDRTWWEVSVLRHINAESWLGERSMAYSPVKRPFKAETKIGADGKVEMSMIQMEPDPPGMIDFRRAEESEV